MEFNDFKYLSAFLHEREHIRVRDREIKQILVRSRVDRGRGIINDNGYWASEGQKHPAERSEHAVTSMTIAIGKVRETSRIHKLW